MHTHHLFLLGRPPANEKFSAQYTRIVNDLQNIHYALDQSSILAVTDESGIITYVNDLFCEVLQYTREEVIGRTQEMENAGFHPPSFFQEIWQTIKRGEIWKGDIKDKAKDGSEYWFSTTIVPFFNEEGQLYQVVSIRNEITDRKKAEKAVYEAAHYDHLTGLPNRRLFQTQLKQIDTNNLSEPAAVIFIDLDRFKNINDTMGHHTGDQMLKTVSSRIQSCLRPEDMVARIGGDEFAVLLPEVNSEEAEQIAKRIIRRIEKNILFEEAEIVVTASMGISMYPDDGTDSGTLIKHADAAMYSAKEAGKNNYQFFTKELDEKNKKKMLMERELHKALDKGQFQLYYQPQFNIETGRVFGVEALIRWHHPKLGMVSPADFIPLAEETGLIVPIGNWVLKTACRQNKQWQEDGFSPIQMSVNVSMRQFMQPDFLGEVKSALSESRLQPHFLDLEVTETMMLEGVSFQTALVNLKKLNIHVSMDDFGTGYSSLHSLRYLPINKLKIDQSFIKQLDETNKAIVSTIVTLAKNLRINVIAEGVETHEQALFLRALHCNEAQGYLYAKPMPAAQVSSLFNHPMAF